jgi:hypothetical protein
MSWPTLRQEIQTNDALYETFVDVLQYIKYELLERITQQALEGKSSTAGCDLPSARFVISIIDSGEILGKVEKPLDVENPLPPPEPEPEPLPPNPLGSIP